MNKLAYERGVQCALSNKLGSKLTLREHLQKTATSTASQQRRHRYAFFPAQLAGTGLSLGLAGAAMGGHALEERLMPKAQQNLDWESLLRKHTDLPESVKVETTMRHALQSHFDPWANTIRVEGTAPPAFLAHEMGHASGGGLGKKILRNLAIGTKPLGMLGAGLVSPVVQALIAEPGSTAWNVATYAPAGLMVPTLLDEARASVRALRALKAAGGKGTMLRSMLSLAPAFATYLGVAATPLLTGKIIKSIGEG